MSTVPNTSADPLPGTTAIADLCGKVRAFSNNFDWTDDLITTWTRFAEERFNDELRDNTMEKRATCAVQNNIIQVPVDFIEAIWLRYIQNTNPLQGMPPGLIVTAEYRNGYASDVGYGRPLRPCTPDEFFTITNDPTHPDFRRSLYMVIGNEMFLNPALNAVNGQQFEMGYIGSVTPLGSVTTPLYAKSTMLYTYACLSAGALYDIEDDRVATWEAYVSKKITSMNDAHAKRRLGGGPLHKRSRGFG